DAAAGRRRAARAGGVEETRPYSQVASLLESAHPVVDGLTADVQQFGDLLDAGSLGQPEQRLGTTSLLGRRRMADDLFQFVAQLVTEREQGHRFTLRRDWRIGNHSTCQRTSVTLLRSRKVRPGIGLTGGHRYGSETSWA